MKAWTLIASAADNAAQDEAAFGRGVIMLLVLTMLLGAFLLAVALLTVIRRRRMHKMQAKPGNHPLPDPWKQSADRLEVDPPRDR